jgi:hypothetical protein
MDKRDAMALTWTCNACLASQNAFPSRVSLNGTECQVMVNNNLNLPVPGATRWRRMLLQLLYSALLVGD